MVKTTKGYYMREARYLHRQYRLILSYTGFVLLFCSGLMLLPLLVLFAWPKEKPEALSFILPALIMAITGLLMWRILRPKRDTVLSLKEGGIVVVLSWIIVCLFSTWPFIASAGLTFTQASFEAVSGWTTTGLSVVDVTEVSHLILLWRSTMQLAGGAGLAVIMLSAMTGPTGPALSAAEGREQLVPHVRQSAKLVIRIYLVYMCVGIIALYLAGMDWFDAINHAFAGLSTGGFSTRVESIGYWDSPIVEAVILALMILGNMSFVTAWLLLRGKISAVLRNGEIRLMSFLLPLSILLVYFLTVQNLYQGLSKSIRVAVFEMVTALTTTGFSTVGYNNWNSFGWLILLVLMLIGGGTCSTAGGIKQYRIYLMYKSLIWQLHSLNLPPRAVVENAVWEADHPVFVSNTRLREVGTYLFLYLAVIIIGTGVFTAYGNSLKESFFEFTSTLGTVGLSVGLTRADAPLPVLWTQIVGMLLGRLEFLIIFAGATKLVKDLAFMLRQPFRLSPKRGGWHY